MNSREEEEMESLKMEEMSSHSTSSALSGYEDEHKHYKHHHQQQAEGEGEAVEYWKEENLDDSLSSSSSSSSSHLRSSLGEELFPTNTEYRDGWLILLYVLTTVAFLVLGIVGFYLQPPPEVASQDASGMKRMMMTDDPNNNNNNDQQGGGEEDQEVDWFWPIFMSFVTIVVSSLATMAGVYLALRYTPKGYIIFSFVGTSVAALTVSIVAFVYHDWSLAVPWLLVSLLIGGLLFGVWYRGRLAFAQLLLATQAYLINRFSMVLAPAFLSLVPQIVLSMIFITVLNVTWWMGWPAMVFCLFYFYWTSTIITSLVHMTASGTFAAWYFSTMDSNLEPAQATLAAFKRAITSSFGSVCLSALILAIVKTLEAVARDRWQRISANIALGFLNYLNRYALTYCAIYGSTLYQAAKQIFHMFEHHGFKAVLQDNITFMVSSMSMVTGGLVGLLAGGLSALALAPGRSEDDDAVFVISMLFIGFFVGMVLMQCLIQIVDAGVVTMFVCFVEHPQQLQSLDPSLYHHFRTTYADTCPSLFITPLEPL